MGLPWRRIIFKIICILTSMSLVYQIIHLTYQDRGHRERLKMVESSRKFKLEDIQSRSPENAMDEERSKLVKSVRARRIADQKISAVEASAFRIKLKDLHRSLANTKDQQNPHQYQKRLKIAEIIWARSVAARKIAATQIKLEEFQKGKGKAYRMVFWDLFYPAFNCPHFTERIGRVGDGGKWVCGFQQLIQKHRKFSSQKSCIVYSFGISSETSFERELLTRSGGQGQIPCLLRMYDPTVDAQNPETNVAILVKDFESRAKFFQLGIGYKNDSNDSSLRTLGSLMKENGDKWIDILKMDVEGAEFQALRQIVNEFGENGLPFGQLQVEIHFDEFKSDTNKVKELLEWFDMLENVGLRAYHSEANMLAPLKGEVVVQLFEYSFINVRRPKDFTVKLN